jgi:hypothetical protein
MAKMTTCLFQGTSISISDALSRRDDAKNRRLSAPHFECQECKKPVRAHKSGGNAQAHFEHLEANQDCSQSYSVRV